MRAKKTFYGAQGFIGTSFDVSMPDGSRDWAIAAAIA